MSLAHYVESPELNLFVQTEGGLAVMSAIKKMVRTKKPALPYEEMIKTVAVMEAARKSHNKAYPVEPERVH